MFDSSDFFSFLLAVVVGGVVPIVILSITGRQAKAAMREKWKQEREEKQADWDRLDKVAAKAAETARLALEAQARTELAAQAAAETAQLALETQQRTLEVQQEAIARADEASATGATALLKIQEQVTAVHALTNSDMTAARELELKAVQDGERFLWERIKLGRRFDQEPSASDEAELAQKRKRIEELEHILAERAAVLVRVEAEQDKDRAAVERSAKREGSPT